ncbi:MAG TPA: hypothetical protein VEF05_19075, partial [Terriglobales bacterium]|nr:hypothetical protein [Terriglobales bacterium]
TTPVASVSHNLRHSLASFLVRPWSITSELHVIWARSRDASMGREAVTIVSAALRASLWY